MNGAESLVDTLLMNNVRVCFANPGTSEIHFMAALDRHPEMRCVLCLFEGGATGAADGYYRMSSREAVTLLHLAPGLGNGFANLHNARKAKSGIVNIVGEHATYHLRHESPLRGDLLTLSKSISDWTRVSDDSRMLALDGAAAVRASRSMNGQIATLILPADTAWETGSAPEICKPPSGLHKPMPEQIKAAAAALKEPGSIILIDGCALWGEPSLVAARIAKKIGCQLWSPYLVARIRRGGGSVRIARMAYRIDENIELLRRAPNIVLCGAARPVSFFAYPDKATFPENPECRLFETCSSEMDISWTLNALADELNAHSLELESDDFQPQRLPSMPSGAISPEKIGQTLAALMPDNAILVNEANSMTRLMETETAHARPHDELMVTGGSIGFGLPVAVGSAIACPARKLVVVVGDGSAMYTVQSLWTMAREGLDVTVVVLANRGYQTLRIELDKVGVSKVGRNAARMFDIVDPALDFVALAKGHGIEATRVDDIDQFAKAFGHAMQTPGPFLVEAAC
jgi:acetolactate synthase I/II/III large subunit